MTSLLKKNIYTIILVSILLLSTFLRFYKLGVNPPSLDWDEASIGYNAYSILKTGADEYGNFLPLTIRSFGDHKPPVYIYLDVPNVAFFGLNEVGVRFPSALVGLFSVLVLYFLVKEIFDKKTALLSTFFFGVSPWSLQFSRTAFEGNIGLFFFLLGFLLFLKSLKRAELSLLSAVSFSLSVYSYHSFLVVTPLFIAICFFLFRKEVFSKWRYYLASIVVGFLMLTPVFLSFITPSGSSSRLSMVSIFTGETINPSIKQLEYDIKNKDKIGALLDNRRIVYSLAFAKGYFDHFNPDFLFFHGDSGGQHHAVNMGMLYLWELPFILIGIYLLIRYKTKKSLLILFAFLIAPLPSAVSTGTPHAVRAIAMAPEFSIFTGVGLYYLFFKNPQFRKNLILIGLSFLFILNFAYYLHQYYVHTPHEISHWWQYGNKEAVELAKSLEDRYDKIIYTYKYDQPYIYYLFYNKIDPSWYQKNWDYLKTGDFERMRRVIGKYEFRNINWGEDSQLQNTLLIGTPEEIPNNAPGLIKNIKFLDGSVAFRVVST